MVSAAAWDGVKAVCRAAYRALLNGTGARRLINTRPEMSEIVERARWYVEQKFERTTSDLVVRGTEEAVDNSWVVELEDPMGTRYVVGYELIDGLLFVKIRRELPA